MRSIYFEQSSGDVVPTLKDGVAPVRPRGADVLVQVAAASINGTDVGLQRSSGIAKLIMSRSRPGFDVAGKIVACGPSVSAFQVGDRVMGLLGHGGGGQAEYVLVPQRRLALIPASISDVDAAALPLAGLTALQGLRRRGHLQAGTRRQVLINGAAGGIGSYAVQLARLFGARVTAITSGDRMSYLRDLGADHVVDRHDGDALDGRDTYDLILDIPGSIRFREARPALTGTGVLVSTRPISADSIRMVRPQSERYPGPRFAAIATSASEQDLSFLARLLESGRIDSPIDRVFPITEVADAYAHAASGDVQGKVVLTL